MVIHEEEIQSRMREALIQRVAQERLASKLPSSSFSIVIKSLVVLIIGLMLLGTQSDKIEPLLSKWQASQEARHIQ